MARLRSLVLVHYHELGLKRGNRPLFLRHLARNLRRATSDLGPLNVRQVSGRVLLELDGHEHPEAVRDRVRRVCGVASVSVASRVASTVDAMKAAIERQIEGRAFASFRISARRAFKTYPMTSVELNRELGRFVVERTGARVDLHHGELEIHVEVMPAETFVYADRMEGPGGLPVGASGTVAALLSGGIDSPVAAWRMMKRGCRVLFVHFHSVPYLPATSQAKARALVERLTQWQYDSQLLLVPFGEIQREVVLTVPPPTRVIVYRRLMVRIAEALARRHGAAAFEHCPDRRGGGDAHPAPTHRDGQARDHRGGAAARHVRDLDRARRRLLHTVRAQAPGHANVGARGRRRRIAPRDPTPGQRGMRRRVRRDLRVPGRRRHRRSPANRPLTAVNTDMLVA